MQIHLNNKLVKSLEKEKPEFHFFLISKRRQKGHLVFLLWIILKCAFYFSGHLKTLKTVDMFDVIKTHKFFSFIELYIKFKIVFFSQNEINVKNKK